MDLAESIRAEQVRTLYSQARPVLIANVALSAMLAGAFFGTPEWPQLLIWVGLIALHVLARVELSRRYARAQPSAAELPKWGRRFVAGSIVAGLLWGGGAVVFYDVSGLASQFLFTFTLGGMAAAAAGTLASHLPAFYGYCVCAILPLALRTLLVGDAMHIAMGSMLIAYLLGMQRVARNNGAAIERAFHLGLENAELVGRLSQSQLALEESNRTLETRVVQRTAEVERQGNALREAQRLELVAQLAGGIAHEFNNLLTIVLTNVDVLEATQTFDPAGRAALRDTLLAAQRGAELIRQLLAFSRRQRTEPRVFDCNRVISRLEGLTRKLAGERIDTHFLLTTELLHVRADPSQLEQALVNLLSNARDAMPNGGTLRVSSECVSEGPEPEAVPGRFALIIVQDSGLGMDFSTLQHAFDPFFSTKRQGPAYAAGSGLGLATVHGIVEQLGGRVIARSVPSEGSSFCIYLPLTDEPESVSHDPPSLLPLEAAAPAIILVAEDEPTLRSAMRRSLERAGHKVLMAEDGERALALARASTEPIDLLITDVVMPNLGGAETARLLSEARPGIAVLFVSGYSWGESLPPSDPDRGVDYLQKPFDTTALVSRVGNLLALRAATRAPQLETEAVGLDAPTTPAAVPPHV